jgi:hypothetical protein
MKTLFNGLVVGLGRKIAFEVINDVKKEHNIKLIPKTSQAFKEVNAFKLGATFNTTSSRLIQLLDSIQNEYVNKSTKVKDLKKYLLFVNSKLSLLELQITNETHETQFQTVQNFYSQVSNIVK